MDCTLAGGALLLFLFLSLMNFHLTKKKKNKKKDIFNRLNLRPTIDQFMVKN